MSEALPRAVTDRPDDVAGPQIHAVYILPSDGVDRRFDTDGTIAASVANFERWLTSQTGGRQLRADTFQHELDVSFVRLAAADATIAAKGVYARDAIEQQVKAAGFATPDKIYLAYYDGSNTAACGGGAWPPTLRGDVAALYLRATYGEGRLCYDPTRSNSGLQLMDLAMLHETLHTLGFVPSCAPHFTRAGHVSDSPNDLMYAGDAPWTPSVLDVGHDDYFEADTPGCPDLSTSPYLVAATPARPAAGACVVPNARGQTVARARLILKKANCRLGQIRMVRSRLKKGRVVSQAPRAGAQLAAGGRVNLVVSSGHRR
jgi:hypothetical protein